jgi:serine/threonine protein kinase
LQHPNIVPIYDYGEAKDCHYYAMELVRGLPLNEVIKQRAQEDSQTRKSASHDHYYRQVAKWTADVADGLQYAHEQGVIHRDIKPGNIMLKRGAVQVKIGDFGLARAAFDDNVELTSQGLAVGTPAYMSPEQVKGEDVDERSDLFSLGCVMYAMIAGRSPFRGQHALAVARKVADESPQPLEKTVEGTPPMLSDMVAKLLEKDPDNRYQSAMEVAEELGRCWATLAETPTDELSAAWHGCMPRRETRRKPPIRWVLITCAFVLVAILASLPLWWPKSDLIEVGKSADADVESINEALAIAKPGTVIRVIDNGTYSEAIQITNAARQRGIVLESNWESDPAQRPTLTVPDETTPVIRIQDVSDVVIRGLRIEPYRGPAISVSGTVAGLVIEDMECYQIRSERNEPGVLIHAVRGTPQDQAIIIRQSRFHNPYINQCIRVIGLPPMGQRIRIEENTFSGRDVLVLLGAEKAPLGDTVVVGNVFLGREDGVKTTGINVNLMKDGVDSNICIHNNTFLNTTNWIGLAFTRDYQPGVRICNNLILGSVAFAGPPEEVEKAAGIWQFEANWWEKGPETDDGAGHHGLIATLKDTIELQNRDDDKHEGYLRPPPDSPLLTSGYGKEGLPDYVGAMGPKGSDTAGTTRRKSL